MINKPKIMAIVFSTFMCLALFVHGYVSLTEYGKNLSNAQLIEELIEEEESETKDGKTEIDELLKNIHSGHHFEIDFESAFQSLNHSINALKLYRIYQEIHLPPPDLRHA
jgi:hypothetical protein